jgi:hypothetical protein
MNAFLIFSKIRKIPLKKCPFPACGARRAGRFWFFSLGNQTCLSEVDT